MKAGVESELGWWETRAGGRGRGRVSVDGGRPQGVGRCEQGHESPEQEENWSLFRVWCDKDG